jgi:hypothetical protein
MSYFGISDKRSMSGIILHVEPNGGQPACSMSFYRAQTSAVTIGRKSSSDHKFGQGRDSSGNVGFPCQVVSGKHAKLAFSDSGYVSIFTMILSDCPQLVCTLSRFILLI